MPALLWFWNTNCPGLCEVRPTVRHPRRAHLQRRRGEREKHASHTPFYLYTPRPRPGVCSLCSCAVSLKPLDGFSPPGHSNHVRSAAVTLPCLRQQFAVCLSIAGGVSARPVSVVAWWARWVCVLCAARACVSACACTGWGMGELHDAGRSRPRARVARPLPQPL